MREIKFRAWNETTKKMMDWEELKEDMTETLVVFEGGCADVPPVMQYTGLQDKNGVEIYEDDIATFIENKGTKDQNDMIGTVEMFRYQWGLMNDEQFSCFNFMVQGSDYEIEVVGNIHENPELLEDK